MSRLEFSLCKTLPCHSLFSTKSVTDSNPSWFSRDSCCKEKGRQIYTKALIIELFLQKGLQKSQKPLSTSLLAPAMPTPVRWVLQFESLKSKEILWNTSKDKRHRKMQKLKPVHLFSNRRRISKILLFPYLLKQKKGKGPWKVWKDIKTFFFFCLVSVWFVF